MLQSWTTLTSPVGPNRTLNPKAARSLISFIPPLALTETGPWNNAGPTLEWRILVAIPLSWRRDKRIGRGSRACQCRPSAFFVGLDRKQSIPGPWLQRSMGCSWPSRVGCWIVDVVNGKTLLLSSTAAGHSEKPGT